MAAADSASLVRSFSTTAAGALSTKAGLASFPSVRAHVGLRPLDLLGEPLELGVLVDEPRHGDQDLHLTHQGDGGLGRLEGSSSTVMDSVRARKSR
jgi:hypothetical protein